MTDEEIMEICIEEAQKAFEMEEVPVGCVMITKEEEIIAKKHNMTRSLNSPTAHAEILALQEAASNRGNYRLTGCTLYVSKEPCVMCAGAIIEARLDKVVFGCFDERRGALGSLINVNDLPLNHKIKIQGGVLKEKSETLLKDFFQLRRGTEVAITGPTRNRLSR